MAGLPGAGKTTLLRTLRPDPTQRICDSDRLRTAVLRLMPRRTRYRVARPAVHLLHRASVVRLALGPSPTVVVHLPATSVRLRRAVTRLARLSRRTAHLVWLDVAAAEAREGQRARGRMTTNRSFERHAPQAERTSEQILARRLDEGWATTLRLDRQAARDGLRIDIDAAEPLADQPLQEPRRAPCLSLVIDDRDGPSRAVRSFRTEDHVGHFGS